jgi:hypothetical protein
LTGIKAETLTLAEITRKLKMNPDVIQRGAYHAAGDRFLNAQIIPEQQDCNRCQQQRSQPPGKPIVVVHGQDKGFYQHRIPMAKAKVIIMTSLSLSPSLSRIALIQVPGAAALLTEVPGT